MADNNINAAEAINDDDDDSISYETSVHTRIAHLPAEKPKEKRFSITFDNFEGLPSVEGHRVYSSTFSCFQSDWCVHIYPGGDDDDNVNQEDIDEEEREVVICIIRKSEGEALNIKYSIGIKDTTTNVQMFKGVDRFGTRTEIRNEHLERGALTVYVTMQLKEFIPKNPVSSMILNLFCDEESADIVFELYEEQQNNKASTRKRARTSSSAKLFHAHRFILRHHSTELAALCATSEGMTPIIINDVKPAVFRHLLYYVYGGEIDEDEFVMHAKDLINAADRYGVTNLKLEAEVWYVHSTKITIENVIDNLLYADAMNCALLKEVLMDFIVETKEEVMQRVSFNDVPGDVCKDLLAAMARREDVAGSDDVKEAEAQDVDVEMKNFSKMRIGDLRQRLDEKGLGIDGSREALIATLKEHS